MGTSLYQLYDGTLKLAGCKKLLWHRIPIDEDKIQMLDKASRDFPFKPSEKMECQCVFACVSVLPLECFFETTSHSNTQVRHASSGLSR